MEFREKEDRAIVQLFVAFGLITAFVIIGIIVFNIRQQLSPVATAKAQSSQPPIDYKAIADEVKRESLEDAASHRFFINYDDSSENQLIICDHREGTSIKIIYNDGYNIQVSPNSCQKSSR